ncbi:MAG: chorismate synthase, partial [Methanomicrobiales archaeon]|nr:chorismate synthase [Methanomicrobiales archaeon]
MNTFGRSFRCTTFGESHGKAVGVVIDGCPPGIDLIESDIQPYLDRRRPGKSPLESARQEPDRIEILSGTFGGRTTGAPIALIVRNRDARSGDYDALR